MNILILGSEGFIGRNCVKFFKGKGWEIHGCDLVDYPSESYNYSKLSRLQPSYDEIFKLIEFDVCINAAGNGSVPKSIEYPLNDFDANCIDVIRVLELLKTKNKNCKYIHISSAAVYGNPERLPIKEEDLLSPLSPYGWHKYISEVICKEYNNLYNLPIAIIRPFSIYGPGLHKQIFWDLYQKCKDNSKEITLWGTGYESRDFIYIIDLINAIDKIIQYSPMQANVYNLASGIEVTIRDAAEFFINNYNSSIKINFNNQTRQGDPKNWKADITSIKSLGYKSIYDFNSGILETTKWLKGLE
jgi:nucleoside-diphosphate-sugar epimerase